MQYHNPDFSFWSKWDIFWNFYESHINYFIAAVDPKDAKRKVLSLEEFQKRSMHIDGIKEISKVDGYEVKLIESSEVKDGKVFSYDESSNL